MMHAVRSGHGRPIANCFDPVKRNAVRSDCIARFVNKVRMMVEHYGLAVRCDAPPLQKCFAIV